MAEPLRKVYEQPTDSSYSLNQPTRVSSSDSVAMSSTTRAPEKQAYQALRLAFTVAPVVAGADKFFDLLGNWDQYVAPVFPRILGISPHSFMMGVGVIEIIAGIGVALKPRIFGYVVSAWMAGIIVNLLIKGQYYDIALRDLGLGIGAFALARLAERFDRRSDEARLT